MKIALRGVTRGRLGIGAIGLGISIAALEASKEYAKFRIAFGKPIAQLSGDSIDDCRHGYGD